MIAKLIKMTPSTQNLLVLKIGTYLKRAKIHQILLFYKAKDEIFQGDYYEKI